MMGRRQKLVDGGEIDFVYARKWYNFSPKTAKWIKRKMNKRFRRDAKREIDEQRDRA